MAELRAEQDTAPGLLLGLGALAGVFICLSALAFQQLELRRLQGEVARLKDTYGAREPQRGAQQVNEAEVDLESDNATDSLSKALCLLNASRSLNSLALRLSRKTERVKRAAGHNRKPRQRRSFIHLTPSSCISMGDNTIIFWRTIFQEGKSFEHADNTITLTESGYFFIYAQVLYQDRTFVMGHFVKQRLKKVNGERTILRCIQSMAESYPSNTCYTAVNPSEVSEPFLRRNPFQKSREKK
uniref:Tumor necrosis factor ligand superfamily member 13B-like protein n=1 Tax=Callorhinchus milii TaxID=7868 RepID=V9L859_CALMI